MNNKHELLSNKSDITLLDEVKDLILREKEIVVKVIEYLKEIEVRGLHLARGYPSMFAFATDFLGYSEAEAHTRIQAARLTQALPEVTSLIQSGEMSLSVAATTQSHFRKENLRRKEQGKSSLTLEEKREVVSLVAGSSRREAEQNLNIHFAQTSSRTLSLQAGPELLEKIEKLMDLMAHKNFGRDFGKMVGLLVDQELSKYEKLNTPKDLMIPKPDVQKAQRSLSDRSRYIPRRIKSLVWTKQKGKCSFKDPLTGKTCESSHGVQIDHRHPVSRGGTNEHQNLTLLCAGHNQWKGNRILSMPDQ
jgi:hypothetical protein